MKDFWVSLRTTSQSTRFSTESLNCARNFRNKRINELTMANTSHRSSPCVCQSWLTFSSSATSKWSQVWVKLTGGSCWSRTAAIWLNAGASRSTWQGGWNSTTSRPRKMNWTGCRDTTWNGRRLTLRGFLWCKCLTLPLMSSNLT